MYQALSYMLETQRCLRQTDNNSPPWSYILVGQINDRKTHNI